jgi:hypothetical protein
MELSKQIYDLLESEEKARCMIQKNQERFEQQCGHFRNRVLVPVFNNIQQAFMSYGRSVDISPSFFSCVRPGVYPKLCISVPGGRIFKYWVEVKQNRDKFDVKRYRSIGRKDDSPQVFKVSLPQGRQLLDDLSDVGEEDIQQDFIELYKRHITMKTSPLRQVQ